MPNGMSEHAPLAAPSPSRAVIFGLAAVWAASLLEAALLVRGLIYFCSVPPAFGAGDTLAFLLLHTSGAGAAALVYIRVRPESRAGRLGATLLAAAASGFGALLLYAVVSSFEVHTIGPPFSLTPAVVTAGVATAVVALPAAALVWGLGELTGWIWARTRR